MQLPEGTSLLISHTRGLPPALKKLLKRRQAIERTIGHMKTDGLLARNWLKGREGDAIHAVLCGAGHNLRLMLAQLRVRLLTSIALIVLDRIDGPSPRFALNTPACRQERVVQGRPSSRLRLRGFTPHISVYIDAGLR